MNTLSWGIDSKFSLQAYLNNDLFCYPFQMHTSYLLLHIVRIYTFIFHRLKTSTQKGPQNIDRVSHVFFPKMVLGPSIISLDDAIINDGSIKRWVYFLLSCTTCNYIWSGMSLNFDNSCPNLCNSYILASSPGPPQKLEKGPAVTCKNSCMCWVSKWSWNESTTTFTCQEFSNW